MQSVIRPWSHHFPLRPGGGKTPLRERAPRSERWLSSLRVWQASEARSLTGPGPSERSLLPSQAPASGGLGTAGSLLPAADGSVAGFPVARGERSA